tara:strand:+ start:141 stop:425 length:285 start_codon:yes stop_codon:yes gene_type:complete
MQKIINVLAVASGLVSAAVVASGVYVYVNRDSIVDGIKSQAIEAVTGSLGGGLGGGLGAPDLKIPNDAATAPQASAPQASAPSVPSAGLGVPTF